MFILLVVSLLLMFAGGLVIAYAFDNSSFSEGVGGLVLFLLGLVILGYLFQRDMKKDCYLERKEQTGDTTIIYKIRVPCDSIKIIKQ